MMTNLIHAKADSLVIAAVGAAILSAFVYMSWTSSTPIVKYRKKSTRNTTTAKPPQEDTKKTDSNSSQTANGDLDIESSTFSAQDRIDNTETEAKTAIDSCSLNLNLENDTSLELSKLKEISDKVVFKSRREVENAVENSHSERKNIIETNMIDSTKCSGSEVEVPTTGNDVQMDEITEYALYVRYFVDEMSSHFPVIDGKVYYPEVDYTKFNTSAVLENSTVDNKAKITVGNIATTSIVPAKISALPAPPTSPTEPELVPKTINQFSDAVKESVEMSSEVPLVEEAKPICLERFFADEVSSHFYVLDGCIYQPELDFTKLNSKVIVERQITESTEDVFVATPEPSQKTVAETIREERELARSRLLMELATKA
ncbi:hypothetical protein BC833DRAFT_621540, partial [Globomyces pollinis-pini]